MMYSNWNDSIHPSEEMNDDILEDLKVIGKTIDKQIDEDRFELDIDDLESNICIYPKQVLVNRSTVIRLNDEEVSNEETKTFLKIIEESGYSDLDNTQLTNWNCCIIQKDSNIIRLDFESELDYCAFVVHMKLWSYNVGKGARTGFCKIHDNIPSEARESFLFSKSLSTALFHFSPRNTEPYGWSKYILDKEILSIVDDSSNQILRIDVRNIIALILCKDYLIPVDYLLNIQLSFPSQVLFDSSQVKLKASTVLGDLIVAELGEWNQSVVGNSCNGFFCLSNTPTDKFQFTLEASDFDTNVPLLTKTIDCSLFLGDYLAQDTDNVTMAEDTCYFINKPRHISPKRINTDVHVSTSVQLQTENIGKVFRLVLVRACGINTAHGTIPSVYCVVYLIDKYGNRLSANKAQMRSIACKSNDPSWNKEFLLELSQQECQHTDHVMILLRDANSGILKHRHVGQVLIPLSCFLPELDANLCLPIEPSFRMDANDSQKSYLGEVNVITRLLIPSATTPRSKQSRNVADVNTLNERNNVTVRYRIFRCVASVTWWPFNLFYHDGKHERIGMNDCTEGFLLLGIESIILKRLRSNIHETIKYSDVSIIYLLS